MSCPISWSIIIKRETTKARTIFCFSPSLLCKIAMRHVRSAVESGSVAYSNITAVSHEYFGPRVADTFAVRAGSLDSCPSAPALQESDIFEQPAQLVIAFRL